MSRSSLAIAVGAVVVVSAVVVLTLWPVNRPPANVPQPSPVATVRPVTPTPTPSPSPQAVAPTLRFVNFGDWGNGPEPIAEVFRQMERTHDILGFTDIVTNGDNNYGSAESFWTFVEKEFGQLLAAGVEMHFSLGNHDVETKAKLDEQISNPRYGEWDCRECLKPRPASAGNRYYSFYRAPVRFVMLDSDLMLDGDTDQYGWAAAEVSASVAAGEPWQALVFHHPPFSAAQAHGGIKELVDRFKPLLPALGVDIVFTGHDHTYERIKTTPECGAGVQYVVSGAIRLRKGDIKKPNDCTAAYWDQTPAFVYAVVTPQNFSAQVITKDGTVVDTWELTREISN